MHDNWPKRITVSGFSLILRDLNGTYLRKDLFDANERTPLHNTSDDAPIYLLQSYWLYHIIPISTTEIIRINGQWLLRKQDSKRIYRTHSTTDRGVEGLIGIW